MGGAYSRGGGSRVHLELHQEPPVGRDRGPGQAVLFGTTDAFLEKLGDDVDYGRGRDREADRDGDLAEAAVDAADDLQHGATGHLTPAEVDDLVAFLKALPYEPPPD